MKCILTEAGKVSCLCDIVQVSRDKIIDLANEIGSSWPFLQWFIRNELRILHISQA
jgi:hypothetical protein